METAPPALRGDGALPSFTEEELSTHDIKRLLRQASERMRAAVSHTPSSGNVQLGEFTKIETTQVLPRLQDNTSRKPPAPYVTVAKGVATVDPHRMIDEKERRATNQARQIVDPVVSKEQKAKQKKASAGSDWFDLPRTNLTPELKRDLQLLNMRGVLDPKRFYKKESSKAKAPPFSQVGTVIEGPGEYFSARLPNKERKRTLVEEVLEMESSTKRFKRKYEDIQAAKTSGKKAFYKKLKEKRSRQGHK